MSGTSANHRQFEIGVKALIIQNGCVLLLKRRDYHKWEFPGGRINEGETIEAALQRELREELPHVSQTALQKIIYAEQADFTLPNGKGLMLLCYTIHAVLPPVLRMSDEHEASCWANAHKIRQMDLQPLFRKAALAALSPAEPEPR